MAILWKILSGVVVFSLLDFPALAEEPTIMSSLAGLPAIKQ